MRCTSPMTCKACGYGRQLRTFAAQALHGPPVFSRSTGSPRLTQRRTMLTVATVSSDPSKFTRATRFTPLRAKLLLQLSALNCQGLPNLSRSTSTTTSLSARRRARLMATAASTDPSKSSNLPRSTVRTLCSSTGKAPLRRSAQTP